MNKTDRGERQKQSSGDPARAKPDAELTPRQNRQQEREAWMRERMRMRQKEDFGAILRHRRPWDIAEEAPIPDLSDDVARPDDVDPELACTAEDWLALIQLQRREEQIRAAICEALIYRGRTIRNRGAHNERHFTPSEIGALWGVSATVIMRVFRHEPGVIVMPSRGRGERQTLRIPESVVERVHRQLQRAAERQRR
jgi:hypothetical protein